MERDKPICERADHEYWDSQANYYRVYLSSPPKFVVIHSAPGGCSTTKNLVAIPLDILPNIIEALKEVGEQVKRQEVSGDE